MIARPSADRSPARSAAAGAAGESGTAAESWSAEPAPARTAGRSRSARVTGPTGAVATEEIGAIAESDRRARLRRADRGDRFGRGIGRESRRQQQPRRVGGVGRLFIASAVLIREQPQALELAAAACPRRSRAVG